MKTLIVYYSRSGTTRVVARALAKDLPADIEEIHCNRYARGFSNYLLAVYESWKGKRPRIDPLAHALSEYELVVIAGPIWAFRPATPLRTFLTQERIRLRRVAFLLTHGGTAGDRSLGEMQQISGHAPFATLVVREKDVKANRFAAALSSFVAELKRFGNAQAMGQRA